MAEDVDDELAALREEFDSIEERMNRLREARKDIERQIDVERSDIDVDKLKEFAKRPYLINPAGDDAYEVIVPTFMDDFQVGRLDRRVNQYNVFVVDKYTKWMHGVPSFLEDEIDMDDDTHFEVDGDILEFDEEVQDTVENERVIKEHVENVEDGKATIKKGHEHDLIAELIEMGELPHRPRPVEEDDLRDPELTEAFEERSYQADAYERFRENGAMTLCWMTGAGKSFVPIRALDALRYDEEDAKKAVVCAGKATVQQWEQYFEEYAPRLKEEVDIVTYHSLDKLEGEYILIVYDECHMLPADTFSKGAMIPTKYRIGLTASPYREDGRQNEIFALAGEPIGLDWQIMLDILDKEYHTIRIHIVEERKEKVARIKDALDERRTMIFCDSLDFGKDLSDTLGIPFVSGEDDNQLEKIQDAEQVIVSRIADHGISLEDLEVVHEADFLFGSRRQQIQRTGRLLHGQGEEHHIYFTKGEFNKYQKRLYSLIEKGFNLEFVDDEHEIEVPEKYKARISLDTSDGEQVGGGTGGTPTPQDPIDFIKHDRIKEVIDQRAREQGRTSKDNVWEAVLAVATAEKPLNHDDIAAYLDKSKDIAQDATRPLRSKSPHILVEADKKGSYTLNVEKFEQIIKEAQERAKNREKIEELKKEVGL